jgi:hypothetical protein
MWDAESTVDSVWKTRENAEIYKERLDHDFGVAYDHTIEEHGVYDNPNFTNTQPHDIFPGTLEGLDKLSLHTKPNQEEV